MVGAQWWLNYWYPKKGVCIRKEAGINYNKTRDQITSLLISFEDIQGTLKLEGFVNLEQFWCDNSQITDLDLSDCSELKELNCNSNKLTNLNFLSKLKSPEKLTYLHASNNNFFGDLAPLNRFINLETLWLRKNHLSGSLRPLQGLTKLKFLGIEDTYITHGLEHLPGGIEEFYCSVDENSEAKVKVIEQELRKYGNPELQVIHGYDNFAKLLQNWKQINYNRKNFTSEQLGSEVINYPSSQIRNLPAILSGPGREMTSETTSSINLNQGAEIRPLGAEVPETNAYYVQHSINRTAPITVQKTKLENLINSAKEKLKSKSVFSTERENRNMQLAFFFNFKYIPTNPDNFVKGLDNIKEGLSKKLTWGEINEICRTKMELEKLEQNQEQQVAQIIQNQPFGMPSSS